MSVIRVLSGLCLWQHSSSRASTRLCLASLGIGADAWQYCIRHGLLGGPEVSARGAFTAELHVARPNRVERPIHVEPLAHFQR